MDELDIFYGAMSPQVARVFARLKRAEGEAGADWTLSGHVRGPQCDYTRTLPATIPFRDLGPGATMLAQAVVPDPCYWSPSLPHLYQLHVELRHEGRTIDTFERLWGIRPLGPHGRDFLLAGKRWVMRGVRRDQVAIEDLPRWRETGAVLVQENPTEELCAQASKVGVFILALVEQEAAERNAYLRRLARFPSVAGAVLEGPVDFESLRALTPNLLYGERVPAGSSLAADSPAAFVYCEWDGAKLDDHPAIGKPIVFARRVSATGELSDARAACDGLQRDLAPFGDFAGYVVDDRA